MAPNHGKEVKATTNQSNSSLLNSNGYSMGLNFV
jgi:hypothetical protein